MTWDQLKQKVDEMLQKDGLDGETEVALDMEPDQDVKAVGISTRFDGVKSVFLSSMEYDLDKLEYLMTCIRCNKVSLVHGQRTVCYECDPTLYPRNEDSYR